MVLHTRGDDVVTRLPQGRGHTMDSRVVRLSATAGKNHLPGTTIQHFGDPLSGFVQSVPGFLTHCMDTGRVAKVLSEKWNHRLEHLWVQ